MSGFLSAAFRVSIDRPWTAILLCLLLTGLAMGGFFRPTWIRDAYESVVSSSDEESDSSSETAENIEIPAVDPISLSGADAVIVVQSDSLFTRNGIAAIRHVVDSLEAMDYVDSILWMDRVPTLNIFGLPQPLFPRGRGSDARYAEAREKAWNHPLVGGHLLSEDGKTTLLLVEFDYFFLRRNRQADTELKAAAERAMEEFPQVEVTFLVTGRIPATMTIIEAHESNQVKYQTIGYGVVVLMAVLLFRGIRIVLIIVAAPIAGLIWTLGIVRYLDLPQNPFVDVILPVLLLLVGLTDAVHLMVEIRRCKAASGDNTEAGLTALRHVGTACFLTSLTTAIGFGSLLLTQSVWVQDFGLTCVIGVTVMFLSVVTVIPLLARSPLGRNIEVGEDRNPVNRSLLKINGLINLTQRRSGLFSFAAVAATILCAVIAIGLQPDERRANALPEGSESYTALQHMDQVLGGLEFSSVQVRWQPEVDAMAPEILEIITEVDDLLNSESLINYPLSIRNLIDTLPGEGASGDRMPMLDLLPPQLKRAFYTPEYRSAAVTFRVQDLGIARFGPVFARVDEQLREIESRHPGFTLELEGEAVWRWKNLYQMLVDLALSLGTASGVILIVMGLAFRSLRIGLISIVPNLFPLAATGVWMRLTGQSLELVSVLAFTVCLGIAVDDTIHFLTRYRDESADGKDRSEAIRKAFTGVGVALIMTTTVLLAGFFSVSFSDSRDHRTFATMGGLTIAAALFADLVFLPALLHRFAPQVQRSSSPAADGADDKPTEGTEKMTDGS